MNSTPHYDLLPLMWWENPWTIGALAATAGVALLVSYLAWRIIRTRNHKPIDPRKQLRLDLQKLQTSIGSQACTIDYTYQELMRIIREYSHIAYALHDPSHTDEEFINNLIAATPPPAPQFLHIVEKIKGDVYEAKFAHSLFPAEHVQSHIHDLIAFLEQESKQTPDKNT